MNHHYPPKPTLPGARFAYDRWAREASIRQRAGASNGARISDTTAGVFVEAPPKGVTKRGGAGVTFEGEYDVTRDYDAFTIVVVSGGGPSSGSYISLLAVPAGNPPTYPDTGVYWRILGRTSEVAFFF